MDVAPVLVLAQAAEPQQNPQQPRIAVDVKVVNVFATVQDKHGAVIQNLTKDDFELQEEGRPQTIRYFSQETDLPLTLGLLVDTSLSQRRVLGQERSASETFLDQVLRENKDKAFLIHFEREVELLQDVTSSRQLLQSALAEIQTPQFRRAGADDRSGTSSQGDPGGQGHRRGGFGGGTLLYDAVYLASKEVMGKQQGRKALIVLSDGVDRGSQETLASAIEAAQRADTLVYSILFSSFRKIT
jgi:VWFA-related protein